MECIFSSFSLLFSFVVHLCSSCLCVKLFLFFSELLQMGVFKMEVKRRSVFFFPFFLWLVFLWYFLCRYFFLVITFLAFRIVSCLFHCSSFRLTSLSTFRGEKCIRYIWAPARRSLGNFITYYTFHGLILADFQDESYMFSLLEFPFSLRVDVFMEILAYMFMVPSA